MTKLYTAKPSEDDPEVWIVYDMYQPLPAKPIFVGTMEEAGAVADAKNAPHWNGLAKGKGKPAPCPFCGSEVQTMERTTAMWHPHNHCFLRGLQIEIAEWNSRAMYAAEMPEILALSEHIKALEAENERLGRAWLALHERMTRDSASHRDYFEKSRSHMAELSPAPSNPNTIGD